MRDLKYLLLFSLCVPACRGGTATGSESADEVRIVSLHDTSTEILVGVGAAQDLAAIVDPVGLSARAMEALQGVQRLPRGMFSPEFLVALRPTHVFGTEALLESQPWFDRSLEVAGIEVFIQDPQGLQGLWDTVERTGSVLGRGERAMGWISEMEAILADRATVPEGADLVRVFFYDCCDPPFTAGGRVPLTELLPRIGARNVFDDLDQDWTRVSWESVLAREPELIVVHDYEHPGQGRLEDKRDRLRREPLRSQLPAVRAGAIVSLPLALVLEGPRTLEALPMLEPHVAEVLARRSAGGSR